MNGIQTMLWRSVTGITRRITVAARGSSIRAGFVTKTSRSLWPFWGQQPSTISTGTTVWETIHD